MLYETTAQSNEHNQYQRKLQHDGRREFVSSNNNGSSGDKCKLGESCKLAGDNWNKEHGYNYNPWRKRQGHYAPNYDYPGGNREFQEGRSSRSNHQWEVDRCNSYGGNNTSRNQYGDQDSNINHGVPYQSGPRYQYNESASGEQYNVEGHMSLPVQYRNDKDRYNNRNEAGGGNYNYW